MSYPKFIIVRLKYSEAKYCETVLIEQVIFKVESAKVLQVKRV